jgi:exopolysaccharide biosynthesis WecB/TagA/CpsF family protein
LQFAGNQGGKDWAVLFNVLRGDLAWAGTRALSAQEAEQLADNRYFELKAGVVSPYSLKKKVGLAYDDELATNYAFFSQVSIKNYIGLCVRALIGSLLGGNEPRFAPKMLHFFGVDIANTTMPDTLDWFEQHLQAKQKTLVAFVNPACLNIAYTHDSYKQVLQTADRVLPDGIGINIGARLLNQSLLANVNGTDLFPRLCERAANKGYRLFLLGGLDGVAEKAAQAMQQRYPALQIVGTEQGYFTEAQELQLIERINQSGADILLVGFGVPKQELWLSQYREQLTPTLCMGIGGLFDYYSGRIPRAPEWLRDIGLEWVWRLMQEPSRMWKRYLIGNPVFLYRVWRQGMNDLSQQLLRRYSRSPWLIRNVSLRMLSKRWLWRTVIASAYLAKRLIDIVASIILMIAFIPLFLVIMALIYKDSPGPVFFKQTRVGRWGKLFTMLKFRSMYLDADKRLKEIQAQNEMAGGVLFKMKNDPRIIPVGRFIRKASIDELPQLWNVLKGDMSLVGPRPALPSEVNQYSLQDRKRLEVIPGITCIWQVSGRSDIPFPQQVQLDVQYIQSQSFWLDIKLLLQTIPAVLLSRGAY